MGWVCLTIRIIVKFLKMVYTGIVKNCCVLKDKILCKRRVVGWTHTKLLDPVYITVTSKKLIGNQALASCRSNALNEMIPSFFTVATQATHTDDWMHSSRKFMEKPLPDTTNYGRRLVQVILKVV